MTMAADPILSEIDNEGFAVRRFDEMDEREYRSYPAWSVSQIKLLPEEPEQFHGEHILRLEDFQTKPTAAMKLGTALHETLLQGVPLRIIPRDVLSSDGAKRGNRWKDFAEEHAGEAWLKEDEAEPLKRAVDSVYADNQARALLEHPGDCELAIFRRDEYTGLRRKHRLDKLCRVGDGIVMDLKSATDPTSLGFSFACLDRKYHVQAADYVEAAACVTGKIPEAFIFIAVQVAPPYICRVHTCHREMLELGYTRLREALADLKGRLDSNDWHGDGHDRINLLNLPKKAYQSITF